MAGSKLNVRFYVTQANVRFPCDFSVYRSFARLGAQLEWRNYAEIVRWLLNDGRIHG